jgi:hypothetical protein
MMKHLKFLTLCLLVICLAGLVSSQDYFEGELTVFFGSSICGDSVIDTIQGEQCDGSNLNGQTCESILGTGFGGTLSCQNNCIFDTSQCSADSGDSGGDSGGGGGGGGSGGGSSSASADSDSCVEKWNCLEWGKCEKGTQERICEDENLCGTENAKPEEERLCESTSLLTGGVISGDSNFINFLKDRRPEAFAFVLTIMVLGFLMYFFSEKKNPQVSEETNNEEK